MNDALLRDLVALVGEDGVVRSPRARAVYECDAYTLESSVPDAVVLPRTVEETAAVVRRLAVDGVPLVPRGAGTSLAGGTLAGEGAVVIALTRLRAIEDLDVANRQALVQAGVVNLALSREAGPHGLRFAPDPSSQQACTLGGNIANNSGGPHTLRDGVTVGHVLAVELLGPDGTRRWIGNRAPHAGGPDLVGAVVGHEGTFGIVTRAWVRLVPTAPAVRTLLADFAAVEDAGRAVSGILARGVVPAAVEFLDAPILGALTDAYGLSFPEDAAAILLVEIDGPEAGLDEEAAAVEAALREAGALSLRQAADEAERKLLWIARKRAFGAMGRLARSLCTQDGVVPRSKLPEILARIAAVGERHRLRVANVFHAGDGNVHPVLLYDDRDEDEVRRVLAASEEILRACLELGGSLTGEHGIGVEKVSLMEEAFGRDTLEAFARVRAAFDPEGRCNPGKLLPAGGGCIDPRPVRPGRRAAV